MRMRWHAGRRVARGIGLVAGFAAATVAARAAAGDPMTQVAVIADVGNTTADPVDAIVASLALLAEAVAAYLLLVAVLGAVASLPGMLGELARAALRLVSTASLRKALETALGGVMLANATLVPGVQRASTATAPAPTPTPSTVVVAPAATPPAVVEAGVLNAARGATLGRAAPTLVDPAGNVGRSGRSQTGKRPERAPAEPGHGRRGGAAPAVHVVARGDTLWDIAERYLPSTRRRPSEIARYWPKIYAANRGLIGADPDLLLPGTRLSIPAARSRPAVGDGERS